jgi:hypothetical protein
MAFIDRVVEHPGRFTLTNSETGEVLGTFDLTRAEGTITTEGTQLNAANLNSELQSVITEVNENVSDAVTTALSPFTIDSSQNVKVRNLQRGSARVDAKKNKVVTKHVNFPKAFSSVPSVAITPITAAPNLVSFSVKSVTTKGFDLCLYRSSDTDTSFYWIATL